MSDPCNIGPRECRVRLIVGIVFLVCAAGLIAALVATGAQRFWRAGIFVPAWLGVTGVLQARDGT